MELKTTVRVLAVCLVLFTSVSAQINCPSSGTLLQNSQLNAFDGCTDRQGDLTIGSSDCSLTCEVSSLSSLGNLQTIQGSLSISCCPDLITLDGLSNLRFVQSISIYFNPNLTTISGFNSLIILSNSLSISQNPKLASISGFSGLDRIGGYLEMDRNMALTDASGFASLTRIAGGSILSGNALSIVYNTALTDLSFLESLNSISYGTVRIEGNTMLCYAGYPQWGGDGQFSTRTSANSDKGLDWRPFFGERNSWQYTWGVPGGGYPTLVIQNNAPTDSCGSAACHSSCTLNAGCLGPDNPDTCGSCTVVGEVNPCEVLPPPPAEIPTLTIVLAVVLSVIGVVLLLILVLGIWGCVVVGKRYRKIRQGSFDISVDSSLNSNFQLGSNTRAAQQIASMAEPTTGSNVTRKGVKYTPKLDSVIISSYHQNTEDFDEKPSHMGSYSGQKASENELPTPGQKASQDKLPTSRQKVSQDELPTSVKIRKSRPANSRPKSDSHTVVKKTSSSSLMEGSGKEPDTEDILQRLRDENAEIPMNFPWDNIKFGKELGTGDFGKVYHAEAKKLLPGQKKTTIMVKQLKEGATKEERDTFLRPVEAMKVLQHPNVLSLLGVSMKGPSICVMLEYCAQGNFKTYLVRKRRESMGIKQNNQLIKMAIDMAAGLDYLHSKNIAHNDFAARSCLVTSEGKIKLGDYGITRQTFKEDYYARQPNQKALPIRWMAPELIVVQGRNILDSLPVSLPGNIWSFGVALWEICSFAQWPYDDLSNEEVLQTLKTTGKCILENPLNPTDHLSSLFDISQSCWQPADLRPSMGEILNQLKELLENGPRGRRSITNPGAAAAKRSSQNLPQTTTKRPTQNLPQTTTTTKLPAQNLPQMREKSQIMPAAPRKEAANDDTLRRNVKPKRAAPTKPAPGRPPSNAPRMRGQMNSQEEPLIISNNMASQNDDEDIERGKPQERNVVSRTKKEMRKKTDSTEMLISNSTDSTDLGTKKPPRYSASKSKNTDKPKSTSHSEQARKKATNKSDFEKQTKKSAPIRDTHHSELPPPKEMEQAVQEEQTMAEDDFILEPPPRFSQDDDLEGEEFQGAVGGAISGHKDTSQTETNKTTKNHHSYTESTIERKIREKREGHSKLLKRQVTPASLTFEESKKLGLPSPTWGSDEEEDDDQFDTSGYTFDEDFGEPEAMEEDELPSVVLDEDVAALIW